MANDIRRFMFNGEDSLMLPARRDAFVTLKEWMDSIAEELNLPTKTRRQLLVSADEIFTNISSYGYPFGEGTAKVTIDFDVTNAEITLVFSDNGIPYNPLENSTPDISKSLDEREIGGLGIFVVKKLMDTVEYKRENDCNVLILKKKISHG